MQFDLKPILAILPESYRTAVQSLSEMQLSALEEIRMRAGQNLAARMDGREWTLSVRGNPVPVSAESLKTVVSCACGQSIYAASEPISQGYLTLSGGHRIGICGTIVPDSGAVGTIREFSSLNIRVARCVEGIASPVMDTLRAEMGSVLIIGPPGSGKTTLLRDLIRQLSDRMGIRVGLADERGEVAASSGGIPQFNVGRLTDVMTGGEKSSGMMRLLRSMNPQVLAFDEISEERDLAAMQRAGYCGVYLAATAHAFSRDDLFSRPVYRTLIEQTMFSWLIVLQKDRTLRIERLNRND